MKIGIIGIGDIAKKAYLPVFSNKGEIEFHVYTRDQEKLAQIGEKYRFKHLHESLDSLIKSGVKAAFVHTSTHSHYEIVKELLLNDIHVYVEKPITFDFETSKELIELANQKNLKLMVGFNRRYAPSYQTLKDVKEPNMIIMQKNRQALPDQLRSFVFEDFIHVVDTLRFLFPYPIEEIIVNGKKEHDILHHVVIQFVSKGCTAIGIMNRDSGTTEEKVEVMSSDEKRVVYNVADIVVQKDKNEQKMGASDWESTLHKRGFEQIVEDFLHSIHTETSTKISNNDSLITHRICEEIVSELTRISN